MATPLALVVLVFLGVTSLGAAAYVYLVERSRRGIVGRTSAPVQHASYGRLFGVGAQTAKQSFARALVEFIPESWASNAKTETELVQAGYDSATAPLTYAAVRVGAVVGIPVI